MYYIISESFIIFLTRSSCLIFRLLSCPMRATHWDIEHQVNPYFSEYVVFSGCYLTVRASLCSAVSP